MELKFHNKYKFISLNPESANFYFFKKKEKRKKKREKRKKKEKRREGKKREKERGQLSLRSIVYIFFYTGGVRGAEPPAIFFTLFFTHCRQGVYCRNFLKHTFLCLRILSHSFASFTIFRINSFYEKYTINAEYIHFILIVYISLYYIHIILL